ncbi:MAG: tetratricopeptide repeat protein [Acidobacteriota bacterium]
MTGLDTQRWRQAAALLDELLELDGARRAARLAEVGARDPVLHDEVQSLLAADARAGDFLSEPFAVLSGEPEAGDQDSQAAEGMRVGPYRLVREIGRGGMGVVHLGERVEGGFEQRVAVKLLKRGMDSDAIVARFDRERQILARLVHPNIATLLDGGVTADGRPFFAMEHVTGEPITTFCDSRTLGVSARVRLLADVCTAVQHAHANLVVHRDLKPGNILVDGEGRVKLLDFGIAKLLSSDADLTIGEAGVTPLTPAYAAPEQLTGGAITTATDVYALGAVLFELLCGRRPRAEGDADAHLSGPVGGEPPSLVRALARAATGPDDVPEELARRRGISLTALRRQLAGDLDAIVSRAMAHDPSARYASAEGLADDLRRWSDGRTVRAHRSTAAYRTRRFVARHRVGVAATALAATALVATTATAIWQARAADREASRARAVTDFLLDIFTQSDPTASAHGRQVTALEVVESGARRLDRGLAGEPEVRTELTGIVGDLYRKLGAYDRAAPLLSRSLAEARARHGERHPATAAALERWALLQWGRGDYAGAERTERRVVEVERGLYGPHHPTVAASLSSLASIVSDLGRYDEAAGLHRQALAADQATFGDASSQAATDLRNLGLALFKAGKAADAEPLLRKAILVHEQVDGPDHPATLSARQALAVFLSDQGRYDQAEPIYDALVPALRARLGDADPTLAEALDGAAQLKLRRGELDEALRLSREEVAIRRRVLGPQHPDLAVALNNLASVAYACGDWDEAEKDFREAIAIWTVAVGPGHVGVALATGNLGVVLLRRGGPTAAEPVLREALALQRKVLSEGHPQLLVAAKNLAQALVGLGRLDEADRLLTPLLPRFERAFPPDHPRQGEVLVVLGELRLAQGRAAEAAVDLARAVTLLSAKMPPTDPRVGLAQLDLARALIAHGERPRAREQLVAATAALQSRPGYTRDLERARTLLASLPSRAR